MILSSPSLSQVVETCIMVDQGWQKVGHTPQPDVTLTGSEDGIKARFQPSRGNGWRIDCQGIDRVGYYTVRILVALHVHLSICVYDYTDFHLCRFC